MFMLYFLYLIITHEETKICRNNLLEEIVDRLMEYSECNIKLFLKELCQSFKQIEVTQNYVELWQAFVLMMVKLLVQ
jgi:hypothetical protein